MMKFDGTYKELRKLIKRTGTVGKWTEMGIYKSYKTDAGAILNWWPSSGALNTQGRLGGINALMKALSKFDDKYNMEERSYSLFCDLPD